MNRTSADLQLPEAFASAAYDLLPAGILIAEARPGHPIVYANRAFSELTGYPPEEVLGRSCRFLQGPGSNPSTVESIRSALVDRHPFRGEILNYRKDGAPFWNDLTLAPLSGPDGEVTHFIGIQLDITAAKLAERDLRLVAAELGEARDRAEAANRAKSTFLATMSHEIRTPMNGVLGTAELLLHTSLTREQRHLLETLRSSGQLLLRLLNQVLDLSKIEADRMEVSEAPFPPDRVVTDAVELVRPGAQVRGLSLAVEIDWPGDLLAVGDELHLQQILQNYLDNAIKHSREGAVRVSLTSSPLAGEGRLLRLTVEDDGPGISEEDCERLFQPFQQLEPSRRLGGTGLGLAICRRLAALMKGSVGCAPAAGGGASFWVEVPVGTLPASSQAAPPAALGPGSWKGRKVLLAEDDGVNQIVARTMLELLGLSVDVCHDGREVVEAWRDGAWDAVLMDCQMPGLDGWQATAWIRAHETAADRRTPVIALTAYALDTNRRRCLEAGMDDILIKPLTLEELSALFRRLWPTPG
jgi:hypothetical protein